MIYNILNDYKSHGSYRNYKTQNPESNWQYSVGHCAQRKVHSRAAAIAKDREDP